MRFSVVIPAHNESKYIQKCFQSIALAQEKTSRDVEVIVVLNRCTDSTEEICENAGVVIVKEDAKNLSKIRNAGARAASGNVIVTIDADSQMSTNVFQEIENKLISGKFIGGGARIKPERFSMGILMSSLVILPFALAKGIPSAGLFWCYKKDFDAIGGFNEKMVTVEDLDFAVRLKARGQLSGRKYGTLWRSFILTSCRKFDKFGDWYFFKNPRTVMRLFNGRDHAIASKFYYEIKR